MHLLYDGNLVYLLCFRMTKMKNVWRCDECGEEWESSYYDTFDDVDVRHCFTGPHTAG